MSALLVVGSVSVSIVFGLGLAKGLIALMLTAMPPLPPAPVRTDSA